MMRTAWTAWTTSGGRTSRSSPTRPAGASRPRGLPHRHRVTPRMAPGHQTSPRSHSSRAPSTSQTGPGLHPSPPLTHPRTHIYANTLDFLFLHETVSQSKVSCCCCYCPTIIATLRGNFTILGSHEPTMIHLCTKCHLLTIQFLFLP